ncbi:hypothetical protein [Leminorella grimontii]|uniref:hypothetical protein n=1 Tax=Leminorella grimontii TaxID=82981 RepID=UPI00321F78AC
MNTSLSNDNTLVFAIINSDMLQIINTIQHGFNWPSEPSHHLDFIKNVKLPIQKGGKELSTGVFYYLCDNDNKLIFTSNLSDGWNSLLYCISRQNKSNYLLFRIHQGEPPLMEMSFVEAGNTVRLIRVMKESKWEFYEIGAPLWFEQKEHYSHRKISDRVTYELLLSYSIKNGVDFTSPNFFRTQKESLWMNEIR